MVGRQCSSRWPFFFDELLFGSWLLPHRSRLINPTTMRGGSAAESNGGAQRPCVMFPAPFALNAIGVVNWCMISPSAFEFEAIDAQ